LASRKLAFDLQNKSHPQTTVLLTTAQCISRPSGLTAIAVMLVHRKENEGVQLERSCEKSAPDYRPGKFLSARWISPNKR